MDGGEVGREHATRPVDLDPKGKQRPALEFDRHGAAGSSSPVGIADELRHRPQREASLLAGVLFPLEAKARNNRKEGQHGEEAD